jgi:protein-disulfide isomerase
MEKTKKRISLKEETIIPDMSSSQQSQDNFCCENCMMCNRCMRKQWWKPKSYVPLLIVLLLVGSFFLGMLLDKVQYLQAANGGTPVAGNQQQQPNQQGAQQPMQKQNVALGNFPLKGDKNAKVTIIEFADPRCPFCKRLFTDVEPQLFKDYVDTGKAKFAFRLFSFLGPASDKASNALECANEQGKFWDLHDYFYNNQPSETDTSMFTDDNLTQVAGNLGMNTDQFKSCISSNKDNSTVQADLAAGQKAGVSGTPTVFINGTPVVGAQPYSAFKTIIDQELAKK